MRFNDAVIGCVLIVFALAVILYASTFPGLHGQAYGPDLFPSIIGTGLIGCGVILVVRGWASRRTHPWVDAHNWVGNRHAQVTLLLTIASVLAFIFLADLVGFIVLAVPILILLAYRFGVPFFRAIVLAIVASFIIHFLFVRVLLVPLPLGLLETIGR